MLQKCLVFACNSSQNMACQEFASALGNSHYITAEPDISEKSINTLLKTCLMSGYSSEFAMMFKTSQESPHEENESLNFSRWHFSRKEAESPCCKHA